MHQIIDSRDDVIALTISHQITGADLDAVMDRLDETMSRHETIHVFVETRYIEGIELSGISSYARRAMPLFRKLGRFGRVAVVADQGWIRFSTRVESAILPFISYRVFRPEQREEALGWVEKAG